MKSSSGDVERDVDGVEGGGVVAVDWVEVPERLVLLAVGRLFAADEAVFVEEGMLVECVEGDEVVEIS